MHKMSDQAKIEELKQERDAAQSYLGELSARMPTTATIMCWFSAKRELEKKLSFLAVSCKEPAQATAAKESLSLLESKSMFHPRSIDAGIFSLLMEISKRLDAIERQLDRRQLVPSECVRVVPREYPFDFPEAVQSAPRKCGCPQCAPAKHKPDCHFINDDGTGEEWAKCSCGLHDKIRGQKEVIKSPGSLID
jgi:hypothetical protein